MTSDTLLGILMLSLILSPMACIAWKEHRKTRRYARIEEHRRIYWEATRHHHYQLLTL